MSLISHDIKFNLKNSKWVVLGRLCYPKPGSEQWILILRLDTMIKHIVISVIITGEEKTNRP